MLIKLTTEEEEEGERKKEGIRASSKFDHNLIRKSVKTSSTKACSKRQRERKSQFCKGETQM